MTPDTRVNFLASERLVERADALATVLDTDRTTVIVEALRAFVDGRVADRAVRRSVANAYLAGDLTFDQVRLLVGAREALALRALSERLSEESLGGELADLVDHVADALDDVLDDAGLDALDDAGLDAIGLDDALDPDPDDPDPDDADPDDAGLDDALDPDPDDPDPDDADPDDAGLDDALDDALDEVAPRERDSGEADPD